MLRTMVCAVRGLFAPVLVLSLCWAAPAMAQSFDVPDGFAVTHADDLAISPEWRPLMTVRPATGEFAHLSAVHLREVTGVVEDPDDWLRDRIALEIGPMPDAEEDWLSGPDSPFSDPVFDALRKAISELFAMAQRLAEVPLEACDDPTTGHNASGRFRELYCVFAVGPIRQYTVLRLQSADGDWYFTEIRTMNERRLRHLMAIANSFRLDTQL